MKIKNAISETGMMIPDHNVSAELMYIWLARLEGLVRTEIKKEIPVEEILFGEEDNERELSVPDPYSAVYPMYLQTMIYLYLGEYDRYNYLNSLFSTLWSDYAKYYVRTKG